MKSEAALNGFNLPGQRTAIVNGLALLSPNFKTTYKLQAGETAAAISDVRTDTHIAGGSVLNIFGRQRRIGKVTNFYKAGDEVPLNAQDYLLVARGAAATWLVPGPTAPDTMRMNISYEPTEVG